MENSKMLIIVCPTNGEEANMNLQSILRLVESSGGVIFEPDGAIADYYYNILDPDYEF